MAKSHKAQHWIPKSYLRAWADPDAPAGHEPFVHIFSRDGTEHRRRAPRNVFTATDLYTIKMPDGRRDLRLEHGLSDVENAFSVLRKDFLAKRRQLPEARRIRLMVFVAALHARTPAIRDHHMKFWTQVQEGMEELEAQYENATPDGRTRMVERLSDPPAGNESGSMTLDDVRRVTASPMEHTLSQYIPAELPFLLRMRRTILCTTSDPGFITSDAPVVWFNPEWHKRPPMFRSPSFSDALLEISMPVSPSQMMVLRHQDPSAPTDDIEYLDVLEHHVTELNRRTRFTANKEFVVRREFTHPRWFDKGTMPPDAWEALHGETDPLGTTGTAQ